jgi:hypothetical protein
MGTFFVVAYYVAVSRVSNVRLRARDVPRRVSVRARFFDVVPF